MLGRDDGLFLLCVERGRKRTYGNEKGRHEGAIFNQGQPVMMLIAVGGGMLEVM